MFSKKILFSFMAATVLSGCQSSQQSLNSAYVTCDRTGLRPGSLEYQRCTQSVFEDNRQKSNEAATALAVGVAAGAVGAYALSEASKKDDKDDRDRRWERRERDEWQRRERDRYRRY